MKIKRGLGIVITIVLIVICAVVAGVFLYNNSDAVRYRKQMELGNKYLSESNYEQARVAFEGAIEIEPSAVEPYIGLTEACMNIAYEEKTEESYEMAKLACERAIEVDAQNVTFYIGAAESCIYLDYSKETENYLLEATDLLTKKEYDIETYIKISQLYYENDDYESAMGVLEKAMESDSQNQEVKDKYLEIGMEYVQWYIEKRNYDGALSLLEKMEKVISDEEIEGKKREINNILEEQRAELLAKQKAKEMEELDKEILEWLVRNLGLIKEYPILQSYSKSDKNKYYLAYGFDLDYYAYWYTFMLDNNIWTITECEIYDGKSGEMWSTDKNIGETYDLTITDELRSEYSEYKEKQTIFNEYATLFNNHLKDTGSNIYTMFDLGEKYLEEYTEDNLIGVLVYWEKEASSLSKAPFIIRVSIKTETNEMKILDFDDKYIDCGIDYTEFSESIILNK